MRNTAFVLFVLLFTFALSSNSAAADQQIQPGNVIVITVLGYPELSKTVSVRQDGSTDYPLLVNIPIDGMTIPQLEDVLEPILARFVERPRLFITLEEYVMLQVTVEGQVQKPGSFIVKGPISLQGVLTIAGGTNTLADLRNISIIRREFDEGKEITVDLRKYFSDRDNYDIPDIHDGDIIFVPILSSTSVVRVMGAVRMPGTYVAEKNENVYEMIFLAGGPVGNGNMGKILYITNRGGGVTREYYNIKKLVNNGLTDKIPLAFPGDIIVVSEYHRWQMTDWWVSALRDVAIVLSSIIVISRL